LQLIAVGSNEVGLENGSIEELEDNSGFEKLGNKIIPPIAIDNKNPKRILLRFLEFAGSWYEEICCFIM